jgi:RES domain-containing protein
MRVWRLTSRRRAATAFSGEGTRIAGSRWTGRGLPAVYTSQSIALAVLEALVHADVQMLAPQVVIPADLPDDMPIEQVEVSGLPKTWFHAPAPIALQAIGAKWLESKRTAVLRVPSAIVNDECNYLLNPLHPDFGRIAVGNPRAFAFDGRLWRHPGNRAPSRPPQSNR